MIDSYDCATGTLSFHVDVANVPHVPEGTSGFDDPLFYSYTAYYSNETENFPSRQSVCSPAANQDPYTGTVPLTVSVPTDNIYGEPRTGVVTSIDVYVGVGQYDEVTDSATATYIVDCMTEPPLPGGPPESPDEVAAYVEAIVDSLIAVLLAILADL